MRDGDRQTDGDMKKHGGGGGSGAVQRDRDQADGEGDAKTESRTQRGEQKWEPAPRTNRANEEEDLATGLPLTPSLSHHRPARTSSMSQSP